jgi:hypothetical protein
MLADLRELRFAMVMRMHFSAKINRAKTEFGDERASDRVDNPLPRA